jgi:intracellular multiplication protein IcmO
MKLEDPLETWDFFSKTTGESWVTKVDAFQTRPETVLNHYADTRSASSEKRPRIDLLDLKEQREGEAHILFKSKIIRARMFHADPKPVLHMRPNQFLKVVRPSSRVIDSLRSRLKHFKEIIRHPALAEGQLSDQTMLKNLTSLFQDSRKKPIKLGIEALHTLYHASHEPVETELNLSDLEEADEHQINIFTPLRLNSSLTEVIQAHNLERFKQSLLNLETTRGHIIAIEKAVGNIGVESGQVANEIIKDMLKLTHYPIRTENYLSTPQLIQLISKLIRNIKKAQKTDA